MIRLSLELDDKGCLSVLEAEGHSLKRGGDFSAECAAVTCLVRTAAAVCEAEPALGARVSLPGEGRFSLRIAGVPASLRERFRGITDFLVSGLERISQDAPEELAIQELRHGT